MPTLQVARNNRVVEDDQDWSAHNNCDHTRASAESLEAMEDVRLGRNLYGPFATAAEAVRAMLEDDVND